MKSSLKPIISKAVILLIAGSMASYYWCGYEFAVGFAATGGLLLLSLAYGRFLVRDRRDGMVSRGKIMALVSVRFPVVCLCTLMLLQRFSALAVALGATVLVSAILADAVLGQQSTALSES